MLRFFLANTTVVLLLCSKYRVELLEILESWRRRRISRRLSIVVRNLFRRRLQNFQHAHCFHGKSFRSVALIAFGRRTSLLFNAKRKRKTKEKFETIFFAFFRSRWTFFNSTRKSAKNSSFNVEKIEKKSLCFVDFPLRETIFSMKSKLKTDDRDVPCRYRNLWGLFASFDKFHRPEKQKSRGKLTSACFQSAEKLFESMLRIRFRI